MSLREFPNLTIQRLTKGEVPDLPFLAVKKEILGASYELSLVFPGQGLSTSLHQEWKKKDNPVNVLAFPLDKESGEIIITLSKARTEARFYNHSYYEHVLFLFIHACLHLKGYEHSDMMDEQEQKYLKKFVTKIAR